MRTEIVITIDHERDLDPDSWKAVAAYFAGIASTIDVKPKDVFTSIVKAGRYITTYSPSPADQIHEAIEAHRARMAELRHQVEMENPSCES